MICPTCNGTGEVRDPDQPDKGPWTPIKKQPTARSAVDLCHCDGPPHPYSPTWCPKTGPV